MKPTLLLVEDSDDDAFFFERTLQKSGVICQFHHVINGLEAINFLKRISESDSQTFPQVVFLDLKMPLMNGFEVLEWLQKQAFAPQMRVVVLSGSEHQKDKDRATQLGAVDYLVKPAKTNDLDRFFPKAHPVTPAMGARV